MDMEFILLSTLQFIAYAIGGVAVLGLIWMIVDSIVSHYTKKILKEIAELRKPKDER